MLFKVVLFLPLLFNNAENKRVSVTKMPGKWQVGESVRIEGTTYTDTWNLIIALQDGSDSENVDVGLYLSLRSQLKHVILVSVQKDGEWRDDSILKADDFPLEVSDCKKMPFQIEIKAAKDQYEVSVNDHKYTFPYQTGLDHLTHLRVEVFKGEATVSHIDWSMNENDDAACPSKNEETNAQAIIVSEIPGKWQIGESLKIQGTLSQNFKSFNIKLQKGSNLESSDSGLLISMKHESQGAVQVLTSIIKDEELKDPEVHDKDVPIDVTAGCKAPFEIEIKAVEDQCEITIQNQKYTVPTQFQLDSLTHVLIGGDVSIENMDWSINKNSEDLCLGKKPTPRQNTEAPSYQYRNHGYSYLTS